MAQKKVDFVASKVQELSKPTDPYPAPFNNPKGQSEKEKKMNKLIRKAKAGVTLVELLVVVLIVTILSVSLLPLLKPFVVESQYAAEAIPAIGNLRTKIALYQYDKGKLPSAQTESPTLGSILETWSFATSVGGISDSVSDTFIPGYKTLATGAATDTTAPAGGTFTALTGATAKYAFGTLIDVDNQELVGKRCKPVHFQYAVVTNGSSYCYVLGCFGDKNGLPEGTGYAVCEISVKAPNGQVYKQIGTWSRYKAATDGQLSFASVSGGHSQPDVAKKSSPFCPIPAVSYFASPAVGTTGNLTMVDDLREWGWDF